MTDSHKELFQIGFDVILADAPPPVVDLPRTDEGAPGRKGWLVAATAALLVFVLVGAIALLRSPLEADLGGRPASPTTSLGVTPPTSAVSLSGPELPALPSVAARLTEVYREDGRVGFHSLVRSDEIAVVAGWWSVLVSDDGFGWRRTGGRPDGEEALLSVALQDDRLVGIGATDGNHSAVYRSDDLGTSWELVDLPLGDDVVQTSAQAVFADDDGFVVAGMTTTSDFDSQVSFVVWESSNGNEWTVEQAADLGRDFATVEAVVGADGRRFVVLRTFGRRILIVDDRGESGDWSTTDITEIVRRAPATSFEFVNTQLLYAVVDGGQLTTWWSLMNNGEYEDLKVSVVVAEQQIGGRWEAFETDGPAPARVAWFGDRYIGFAQTTTPFTTSTEPAKLITSNDGRTWTSVGELPGVELIRMEAVDDRTVLLVGNETSIDSEGNSVVDAGVMWTALVDDLINP